MMPKKIIATLIPLFFISSAIIIPTALSGEGTLPYEDELLWNDLFPNMHVPTNEGIDMYVVYGVDSYFDITLRDITDPDSHIENGMYDAWCFQKDVMMERETWLEIELIHTYDPNKPEGYQHSNWDEINFIINTYRDLGYNKDQIQEAIWSYMGDIAFQETSAETQSLINYANQYGNGFVPGPGDKIAVITDYTGYPDPELTVQCTVIEVPLDFYEGCPPCYWLPSYCNNCDTQTSDYHPTVNSLKQTKLGDIFDVDDKNVADFTVNQFTQANRFQLQTLSDFTGVLQNSNSDPSIGQILAWLESLDFYILQTMLLEQTLAAYFNSLEVNEIDYPLETGQVVNWYNDVSSNADNGEIARLYVLFWNYNHLGKNVEVQ